MAKYYADITPALQTEYNKAPQETDILMAIYRTAVHASVGCEAKVQTKPLRCSCHIINIIACSYNMRKLLQLYSTKRTSPFLLKSNPQKKYTL